MMILGTFVILIACVLEHTYVHGFYVREPGFSSFYEEPLRSTSLTRSRLGLGRSSASFAPRSHRSERRLGIGRGLGLSGLSSRALSNSVYDRRSLSALYDTQVGNNGRTSKEVLGHSTRVRAPSHNTVRVSNLHRLHQASLLDSPRQHPTSKEVLGHVSTVRSFRQPSLIRRVHEPRSLMATVSVSKKVHSGKTSKEVIGHSKKSASHLRLAGHTRVLQGELQPQSVDVNKIFGLLKKQQDLRKKQQEEIQKHQYELQKQKQELLKKQQKELQKQQEHILKQKYTSKELLGLW